MAVPSAIVLAGLIIAVAIAITFRWELGPAIGQAYRLDRWTGRVVQCNETNQRRLAASELGVGLSLNCNELTR